MKVWPFGAALRGEASNRHMLRWLKTVVVSDVEKASKRRQVGNRKTNASEPLQKCRYRIKRHQNRELSFGARDKSGGNPFTGQAVSGTKVA